MNTQYAYPEIWTPDIQIYNSKTDIFGEALGPSVASVSSSGTVWWARPGVIDVMCKVRVVARRWPCNQCAHSTARSPV